MKQRLLRHIILGLLLLLGVSSYGQQEPMFTQYMNNPQLINPAYAGSHGNLNFNGIFRQQWVGGDIDWAPTTTSISVNGPFLNYKVGVGLNFTQDELGPLQQTGIFTDYSYQLEFDNAGTLSLGLKFGFNFFAKNLSDLFALDMTDPYLIDTQKPLFNAGIGAYYFTEKFFVGASIPKLIRNSLVSNENTYELVGRTERHLYLTSGYVFDISNQIKLKPTAMLRMVSGSPASVELTATGIFADQFWFGLMYRHLDALAVHARVEVYDGFQIGYSYDMTTSGLSIYNQGTHEIFFSYTIKKKGKRILSPRYF